MNKKCVFVGIYLLLVWFLAEYSGQSRPLIPDESRPLSKDEQISKFNIFLISFFF